MGKQSRDKLGTENRKYKYRGIPKKDYNDHRFEVTKVFDNAKCTAADKCPSDFETAIAATSYGKFHYILLLCALPAFWSAVSVPSSASYIFTRAQCDMKLSLMDMGTVNAVAYTGMIVSAMLWGYLSDTLGRRWCMGWGFVATGIFEVISATTQNFPMLLITRFISGFLFNGPFAVVISYLAEVHKTELRARMILLTNLFYTIANTTLPLLAWATITNEWDFTLFGGKMVFHSWNIFLFCCAIPPMITGIVFLFMPESPKFLMSRGRNDEALENFRYIFVMNTGLSKEEYAVKHLVKEDTRQQGSGLKALKEGFSQMAPLFKLPYGPYLLLLCLTHQGAMFGMNTLRLWYPQLSAMIRTSNTKTVCSALMTSAKPVLDEAGCVPIQTDMMVYLQNAIVGLGSIPTFLIGGAIVNYCCKNPVSAVSGVASGVFILLLPYLGNGELVVMVLVTCALAFTSLFGATLSSTVVDLFPTSLRVMAMATFLMNGRVGTIVGAVVFPALVSYGCQPPFIALAVVLAVSGLACFLLPNTTLKAME